MEKESSAIIAGNQLYLKSCSKSMKLLVNKKAQFLFLLFFFRRFFFQERIHIRG